MAEDKRGRDYLKARFGAGKMFSESDFQDLIDANLNAVDDGTYRKTENGESDALYVEAGENKGLLGFVDPDDNSGPEWSFKFAGYTNNLELSSGNTNQSNLFLSHEGKMGVGTNQPQADLDVSGSLKADSLILKGLGEIDGRDSLKSLLISILNEISQDGKEKSSLVRELEEEQEQAKKQIGDELLAYAAGTGPSGVGNLAQLSQAVDHYLTISGQLIQEKKPDPEKASPSRGSLLQWLDAAKTDAEDKMRLLSGLQKLGLTGLRNRILPVLDHQHALIHDLETQIGNSDEAPESFIPELDGTGSEGDQTGSSGTGSGNGDSDPNNSGTGVWDPTDPNNTGAGAYDPTDPGQTGPDGTDGTDPNNSGTGGTNPAEHTGAEGADPASAEHTEGTDPASTEHTGAEGTDPASAEHTSPDSNADSTTHGLLPDPLAPGIASGDNSLAGMVKQGEVDADGVWHDVEAGLDGFEAFSVLAWTQGKNRRYITHAIALNTDGEPQDGSISLTESNFGSNLGRIQFRWHGIAGNYALQMRTRRTLQGAKVQYQLTRIMPGKGQV